ncbi:deoxyribodipyrimidine photo-lyase [Methylobacterium indicum]|uniref:Deoxyribodipyrimidine photolyase n=1 Tax=Methylobacterium indicum TaxID=1775910 RepID=A0ABR5HH68_9HYPH|nr:deoxyribodipyrimidine photo-lyase [Methylobacterium indicum]KMO16198.1 deoxyribodipyrimidine photolyase [Methylobacterium indicum]KMO25997.1 deoxyribodipyrimidine photolyase [Methylobacterium indicum]
MAIQAGRIRVLKDVEPRDGAYVLYLMQQGMRSRDNPALEYAVEEANRLGLPVVVGFGLLDGGAHFPEANARHYAFLLQGLADARAGLEHRGIAFVLRRATPAKAALTLGRQAAMLVLDRGYLTIQKQWYAEIEKGFDGRLVQVEGDVVVPLEVASGKHEFAARTLRPKLHRTWEPYLAPLRARTVKHKADDLSLKSDLDVSDPEAALAAMTLDRDVPPVRRFRGGEVEAHRRLAAYLAGPFGEYGTVRNKPEAGAASHMSPYLHFGQISPVAIALEVQAAKTGGPEDRAAYLEELIVRRELAMNHVHTNPGYGAYATALPDWSRKALAEHADDPRPHLYDEAALAEGRTHDEYWNAAMREMRVTGYMHNHLRMYWGKKILEWSPSPEEAFAVALRLNNRYFLDGRDANSFTNVAWLFGLHDRPWGRRKVFGTVRYLGPNTLKKFDAKAYLKTVDALCRAEEA